MKLLDVVERPPLEPWAEGGKIPWSDPAFSARMLREHLSQAHDRASRRAEKIDRHVRWLHELAGGPGRVLDLGCGPGLYCARLARLGHACVGIDFSPASIAHARAEAEREGLACDYRQRDLREGDFGAGYDLALLVSGELNAFPREAARRILRETRRALAPGGRLVLEVHTEASVRRLGEHRPGWYAARDGLFSDRPHLVLYEAAWFERDRAAVERYLVVDAASSEVTAVTSTAQAYADAEYDALLREAGFASPERHRSLDGGLTEDDDLYALVARSGK